MIPDRSRPLDFRRKLPLLLFTAGFLVLFLLFNLRQPDFGAKNAPAPDSSTSWNLPSIELPDSQPKAVRSAVYRLRDWLLMGAFEIKL